MSEEAKVYNVQTSGREDNSNVATLRRDESEVDYMDMDVFLGVGDEDNTKVSPVTLEKSLTEIAEITQGYIIKSTLMGAFALYKMIQQGLWKSLGYESQDEYLSYGLPFSRRTAFRYLHVASVLMQYGYMDQLSQGEIKNNIGIEDSDFGEGLVICPIPEIKDLLELGISKILILSTQAPGYFQSYKDGILQDKSTDLRVEGKEYSFQELKEMSKREFSKIFDVEAPTLTKPQLKDQVEMLQDLLKSVRNRSLRVATLVTKGEHTREIDAAIETINEKFNYLMTLLDRSAV